jgi:RNA polymerase sigma-70 factor, ECF subfamily
MESQTIARARVPARRRARRSEHGTRILAGYTVARVDDSVLPLVAPSLDVESHEWLLALHADGEEHDAAVARLHALLLRAARFEIARRGTTLPYLRGNELDDIADEAAADALLSVLRRLDDFRGASRFTTWAYKFALLEAAVKLRKRAWQGREIPLEPDTWAGYPSSSLGPAASAEQSELLATVQEAVKDALTPHQRTVLVALALNGVPIDVLAERLDTNRGALYKTLHDARRKLRAHLVERGFALADRLEAE